MKKRLRLIAILFSISFIVMAGLSLFSVDKFTSLINYSYWVDHSNKVIQQLYKVEGVTKDLDRAERGYMLTRDTMYQRLLYTSIRKINPLLDSLKYLTKDNEGEQNNVILVRSALAMRLNSIRENLAFLDTAKTATVSSYYHEGRQAMKECTAALSVMYNTESLLLAKRVENKMFYQHITSSTLKYILFFFCIITIILFILMIRELKRRVVFQDELNNKVADLERSHSELEQIAYAASHDLQEPLRKIQVFINRLLYLKKEQMDEESRDTLGRITSSAVRMQELIEDLVNLTSLTQQQTEKEQVDLNKILKHSINELSEKAEQKNAIINQEVLPIIPGYPGQLQILFKALLDNSLKFTRDGVQPIVSIRSDLVSGEELTDINPKYAQQKFHRITVSDNGIGFDNKFTHKMFQIFQRLHNQHSEFHGKGIGLALSQRIVANHNGHILAYGHSDVGATFKIFFPLEQ
ncbi:MAG: CHASE3 domain-containing protein [Bacteroidetes bacterium]|nr:CHASE3 domain-containing protein [Bacteroidota bacterium]